MGTKIFFGLTLFVIFLLTACTPATAELVDSIGSTPTIHPFFEPNPTISAFPTVDPLLLSPFPTLEITRSISETITPLSSLILTTTIYDEALHTNWLMEASPGLILEADNSDITHSGQSTLMLTGQPGDSLLFRVRVESHDQYLREKVLAISFWIYSRENGIQLDGLRVQAFGSDTVPYWVRNDISAITELKTFSGQMLYGLGLNGDILPLTWERMEILLEALVYDPNFDEELIEYPEYQYFTGFSIIFADGFEGTILLDEVSLLKWGDE